MRLGPRRIPEPDLLVRKANRERMTPHRLEGPSDLIIEIASDGDPAIAEPDKLPRYRASRLQDRRRVVVAGTLALPRLLAEAARLTRGLGTTASRRAPSPSPRSRRVIPATTPSWPPWPSTWPSSTASTDLAGPTPSNVSSTGSGSSARSRAFVRWPWSSPPLPSAAGDLHHGRGAAALLTWTATRSSGSWSPSITFSTSGSQGRDVCRRRRRHGPRLRLPALDPRRGRGIRAQLAIYQAESEVAEELGLPVGCG